MLVHNPTHGSGNPTGSNILREMPFESAEGANMSLKKDYFCIPKLDGGCGGWHCQCCNPYNCSPRKMKSKARRRLRRLKKQTLSKEGYGK